MISLNGKCIRFLSIDKLLYINCEIKFKNQLISVKSYICLLISNLMYSYQSMIFVK